MRYVQLGRSGAQVSPLGLGMMSMGASKWRPWVLGEDESRPIVQRAFELGINFIDTADSYSAGESEKLVGKLVRELGRRDELVIATKVYNPVTFDFKSGQDLVSLQKAWRPNMQGLSRKRIFAAIDASLQRLEMDYVDIYQIHRWDYTVPVEEFMEALNDVVKSGKARYIGASSMLAWQFAKAQHVAERHGWTQFTTMQNHYSLAYREEEREMMPLLRDQGVACLPWSPLARGFLTKDPEAPATIRQEYDPLLKQYFGSEADLAIAREVGLVAKERGITRAQVVMGWLLSPHAAAGGVTAPIVGPQSVKQLEDLVAGTLVELTPQEIMRLEARYQPKSVLGHF